MILSDRININQSEPTHSQRFLKPTLKLTPNHMPQTATPTTTSPTQGLTRFWTPRTETQPSGELIDRVLASRNIHPDEQGQAFLKPSLGQMHDPSEIPDLDRAAERILIAIKNSEPIVIFGDYDVDGMTASAILIHMIRAIHPKAPVSSYIPHRIDEGYGINSDAIEALVNDGAKVIVSVDCGITAIEPAKIAKDLGIDLIITDHHNPPESMDDMPDAYAVVHPRRPDSQYPFGELCGAGVAYKLAWRIATLDADSKQVSAKMRTLLIDLLSFAALGTIADLVPLVDENRVIVKHGLTRLPTLDNPGIQALIIASGLDSDKIDTEAIGFRLAPRLNAIGRLGHAKDALELMTDATGNRATELADQLSQMNEERKKTELAMVTQACKMAEDAGMTQPGTRAIVLAHEDWHPGVVGIVCSRLVDRYGRPTVLMQRDGQVCKGSGRSIDGFNLHAGLKHCETMLNSFGGHDMAAGLNCDTNQIEAFTSAFTQYANEHLTDQDLIPSTRYDCDATLDELTPTSIRQLELIAPFGMGNSRVRLRINGLKINGDPTLMGKTGNHLSMRVGSRSNPGQMLRVVAWNWGRYLDQIPTGAPIEMIIEPKISTWNGNTRVEPILVDLRVM